MDQFINLTRKQAMFCVEYFVDFNATAAALRAGYSQAMALSGKLMTLPKIQHHLQQRGAKLHQDMEINTLALFNELKKIAFGSMGDFFDEEGKVKPMHLVGDDAKAAMLNYTVTEGKYGPTVKIRLNSKLTAIEKIARLLNLYNKEPQTVKYYGINTEALGADDRLDDDSFERKDAEAKAKKLKAAKLAKKKIKDAADKAACETENRLRAEYEARIKQLEQALEEKKVQENGGNDDKGLNASIVEASEGSGHKNENTTFYHPIPLHPDNDNNGLRPPVRRTMSDAPFGRAKKRNDPRYC